MKLQGTADAGIPPSPAHPGLVSRRLARFALIAACAAAYALALGNDFVWDDRMLIVESPRIRDWRGVGDVLTLDFFQGTPRDELKYGYYRPLTTFSYMVDAAVWQMRPMGFHLTNLLLHVAATWLAYALSLRVLRHGAAALLVALLFAVHPVHTETVTWISGRTDLLATVGILGSLLFHARFRESGRRIESAAAAACFALATLAKEVALITPLLFVLHDAAFRPELPWRRRLGALVPAGLVALAYIVIRFEVLGIATGRHGSHLLAIPGFLRLVGFCKALFVYLWKVIAPVHLVAYMRLAPVTGFGDPAAIPSLLGGALFVAAAAILLRRSPAAGFGLGLFVTGLLPVSNVVVPVTGPPDMGFPMAERFLYLPSLGILLAIGSLLVGRDMRGLARLRAPRVVIPALVLLSVAFAVRAQARNREWRDDIAFFRTTIEDAPDAPLLLNNLGIAEHRAGDLDNAERHLRRAAANRRASGAVQNNLALLLREKGKLEEAAKAFEEALRIDPERADIHFNVGETYLRTGHWPEAALSLRRAVALGMPGADVLVYLGTALGQSGDLAGALAAFERASALEPGRAEIWENAGTTLRRLGRTPEAIAAFRKALDINPSGATAWNGLGVALEQSERTDDAEAAFLQAAKLDPKTGDALNNLGVLYKKNGKIEEAERALRQSLEREPTSAQTHGNLAAVLAAQGRAREALDHMRRAISLGASFPPAVVSGLEARARADRGRSPSGDDLNR
jgi:Flp pilus assembly protein TadD